MMQRFGIALGLSTTFLFVPTLLHGAIAMTERDALIALYNATDGANWTDNTNWLGGEGTECTWFGITCHDDEKNVRHLSLRNNNLSGPIPPELGNLERLQSLQLSANPLTGEIPPEPGNLVTVNSVFIGDTQLTGEIPPELGNLINMRTFHLNNNQLTGPIPPELGNLATVRDLVLTGNQLTRIPPELGNLPDIETIQFAVNQLTGPIPPELGNLSTLEFLRLADNRLQGAVPEELAQLDQLIDGDGLDLRFNHLYTNNDALREFLDAKQFGGDWERFQTLQLYYAQFGDGLGLFSLIVLFSLNRVNEATGHIDLLGGSGAGLEVDLNGEIIQGGRQDFVVPPSGLLSFRTDGEGGLQAGSARVTSDRYLQGVVVFGGGNGLAGVGSSPDFTSGFAAPLRTSDAEGIDSGIAVTRPSNGEGPQSERGLLGQEEGALELTLLDADGAMLATAADQLDPNGHKALFVSEVEWDPAQNFSDFLGILQVTSPEPITATVVQVRGDELITMPVAGLPPHQPEPASRGPAGAAEFKYYFAQFADGGGLASEILLLNLSADQTATVQITLKKDDGSLLTVDLNGEEVAGQTQVQIPPGGLQLLATDGAGEPSAGSVTVCSDQPLAGVIVFAGAGVGAAGIGSSAELEAGFLAPMETDAVLRINTGVAIMNLEMGEVTIDGELLAGDGLVLATAEQVKLDGMGHLAIFIDQFKWSVEVDFSGFEGLLRVSSSGRIAATVIQTRPGQFATLPVASQQ